MFVNQKYKMNRALPFICQLFIIVLFTSCLSDKGDLAQPLPDCTTIASEFNADVNPIIQTYCVNGCHEPGGSGTGDFKSNPYVGVKSKVDNGTFEQRAINTKDMPPSGPLSQTDIDILRCWLAAGAPNN